MLILRLLLQSISSLFVLDTKKTVSNFQDARNTWLLSLSLAVLRLHFQLASIELIIAPTRQNQIKSVAFLFPSPSFSLAK